MRRVLTAIALLLLGSPAGAAEGWIFQAGAGGGRAGFAVDGAFRGLWLACGPDGSTLTITTGGTALQGGVDQTAVVTVDGIAFLQRMRATGAANGEPALRRALAPAELRDLGARLGKGSRAEVAMPAGRFALPLQNSGKAMRGLLAACR